MWKGVPSLSFCISLHQESLQDLGRVSSPPRPISLSVKPLQDTTSVKSPNLLRLLLAGTVSQTLLVSDDDLDRFEESQLGIL